MSRGNFLGLAVLLLLYSLETTSQQSVAIGTVSTDKDAVLLLVGDGNQGLILPKVTTNGSFGKAGMLVYNTTDNQVFYHNGAAWTAVGGSTTGGAQTLTMTGNTISISGGNSITLASNPGANAVYMWNGSSNSWTAVGLSGDISNSLGTITVNGLKGKTLPAFPTGTEALVYNGSSWTFQPLSSGLSATLNSANIYVGNSSNVATGVSVSGDATLSNTGALTIANNAITTGKIQDGTIGAADLSNMGAGAGQYLQYNGSNWVASNGAGLSSALSSGQIYLGSSTNIATATGITGDATLSNAGVLTIGTGAITSAKILDGAIAAADINSMSASSGQVLRYNGTAWAPATLSAGGDMLKTTYDTNNDNIVDASATAAALSTTLALTSGGTGATTATGARTNLGLGSLSTLSAVTTTEITNGTIAAADLSSMSATSGQVLQYNGSAWVPVTLAGDMTKAVYDANTDNLIDLASGGTGASTATAARTNLGLGSLSTLSTVTTTEITDGTIGGSDLATNIAINTTGNISVNSPGVISGSGSGITTLNASNISSGTLGLARITPSGTPGDVLTTVAGVATWQAPSGGLSSTLTSANIFVGNGSNVATGVALSGDATMTNAGVLTVGTGAISSTKILDATIGDADISGTAAIGGSKITPAFGAQNISTTGTLTSGNSTTFGTATTTWPAGNAAGVLTNNGTGTLSWGASGLSSTLTSANIFVGNGSNVATGVALSGDATITNAGAITVGTGAISSTKILDATIGDADISGTAAIGGSKITPAFGTQNISTTGTLSTGAATVSGLTIGSTTINWPANSPGTLTNNGTGALSWTSLFANPMTTAGDIIYGGVSGAGTRLAGGTGILKSNGTTPSWGSVGLASTDVSGTLPITSGGTGAITAANALTNLGALSSGLTSANIFVGNGGNVAVGVSLSGDATINNTGVITIANGAISGGTGGKITDGTITNADINAAATIAGTKINPDFGAQNILTTGTLTSGTSTTFGTATTTWPGANAAGVLTNNGTGSLTWGAAGLSSALASANIFVGSGGGIATGVAMGGDATISNIGVLTVGTGAITSGKILDATIADADISATAAIAGTKVTPNFGSQNISTTGNLDVTTALSAGTNQFTVDGTGNITKIRNVVYSFPATGPAGVLTNDGAGNLSWAAGSGWGLSGNSLSGSEFIGSTNPQDLIFKSNNVEGFRLQSNGRMAIGLPSAANTQLTVNSASANVAIYAVNSFGNATDNRGLLASASGSTGMNAGVYSAGNNTAGTGSVGVYGEAVGTGTGNAFGVFGSGISSAGVNYGLYGEAIGGTTNWAAYFGNGNVHITNALSLGADGFGLNNEVLTSHGPGLAPTWEAGGSGWAFGGNTSLIDGAIGVGTNYIGTKDLTNIPLNFIVNNQKAGRIESTSLGSTFLGYQSGNVNTGTENSAFGYQALTTNATGIRNTAFGSSALRQNVVGLENTAIGMNALYENLGSENTGVGVSALGFNTSGNQNTGIGRSALDNNTTGAHNVAMGYSALAANTTGSNNTGIGYQADVLSSNLSNATAIGYNAKVGSPNSLVLGGTGGDAVNVGIGTTSPTTNLDVVSGTAGGGYPILSLRTPSTIAFTSPLIEFSTGVYNLSTAGNRNNATWQTGVRTNSSGTSNPADGWYVGRSGVSSSDLVVNRDGNVGIGTSTPGSTLDLTNTSPLLALNSTGNSSALIFNNSGGQVGIIQDAGSDDFLEIVGKNGLIFNTNFNRRMMITSNGALGLGAAFDVGTSGYVLTSSGPSSTPTWQPSTSGFNNSNEVPRGNGSGLVTSGINSDGNNVSISTSPVAGSKLYVKQLDGNSTNIGVYSDVASASSVNTGFHSFVNGTGGTSNFGGDFYSAGGGSSHGLRTTASGGSAYSHGVLSTANGTTVNYGVTGWAIGGTSNYSIYGEDPGVGAGNWAGYFNGKAHVAGTLAVGTTSPSASAQLHVLAPSGNLRARFETGGGTLGPYISLAHTGGREFIIGSTGSGNGAGANKFEIQDATASQTRMVIDAAGNVGVGINAPIAKLDVQGDINTSGEVTRASTGTGVNMVPIAYFTVIGGVSPTLAAKTSNVTSVTRTVDGDYEFAITSEDFSTITNYIVSCTLIGTGAGSVRAAVGSVVAQNLRVLTYNNAGTLTNYSYSVIIYKP